MYDEKASLNLNVCIDDCIHIHANKLRHSVTPNLNVSIDDCFHIHAVKFRCVVLVKFRLLASHNFWFLLFIRLMKIM